MYAALNRKARFDSGSGREIHRGVRRPAIYGGMLVFSVAVMVAPAGWDEPFQTPTFDEFTVVLEGELLVDHGDETSADGCRSGDHHAGPVSAFASRTDSGARYVAVCLPAFAPEQAHRDESS